MGSALSNVLQFAIPVQPPVLSPPPGVYGGPQVVTITDATPGASIFFTLDGSTPTSSSTPYTGPITVSVNETVLAIAILAGVGSSTVAGGAYQVVVAGGTLILTAGLHTQ